jgi:hypothetical protein
VTPAEAARQLSEIHEQIAKGEVYRGSQPTVVALGGLVGVAAALLQPQLVEAPRTFVAYWFAIAAGNVLINALSLVRGYLRDDRYGRRHTWIVIGQLAPALAAGALVAAAAFTRWPQLIPLLPPIWALLLGLGLFAARPYLPRYIGWVALYHVALAALLFQLGSPTLATLGLIMGIGFGVGQLASATVLHLGRARDG